MTSGGYVGLSIATLLSQHHKVTAVDIIPEKVDMINNRKSPIQDDYIEKYLAEKELKDYEISITLNASFNQVEQLKAVSTYDGAEIFEEISEKGA